MTERALPSDPERERAVDVLVGQMVATRALVSALQAQEAVLLSAAMEIVLCGAEGDDVRGSDLPVRSLAAEVGAALRVSDRSVQRQLTDAVALTERFSATFAALAAGRISRAHANVIMDAGCHLADPELRAAYEASVLPYAESESASRLRPVARLRAERIAPSSLQERHDRARARRAVRIVDLEDGMSDLIATLPAVLAHGAFDRLTQLARDVREAEAAGVDSGDDGANEGGDGAGHRCDGFDGAGQGADDFDGAGQGADEVEVGQPAIGDDGVGSMRGAARRSTDELRADIFADLLLAGAPAGHDGPTGFGAIQASVQVVVPALTLAGIDEGPADLVGHGPIDAETARRLAGHAAGWDRVLTHPVSGAVLAVDRYRPTEDIRRALRVRDRHCRFVGCRQPARRCDLDHTKDAARGGRTAACNLAHLCRRHHVLKHHSAWRVRQLGGGVLEWTSPTGRVYIDVPVSTVSFSPAFDPPPF